MSELENQTKMINQVDQSVAEKAANQAELVIDNQLISEKHNSSTDYESSQHQKMNEKTDPDLKKHQNMNGKNDPNQRNQKMNDKKRSSHKEMKNSVTEAFKRVKNFIFQN